MLPNESNYALEDRILITGSSGFIGRHVVRELLRRGCRDIRCMVRSTSRVDGLETLLRQYDVEPKAAIVVGDLRSPVDCVQAAKGISIIYHLAASFDKSFDSAFLNSALATQNLLEAFAVHGRPKRFVHVSSFAVYSNLSMDRGALLDESSPLEDSPQDRGDAYAFGKLKQEEIVRSQKIPFVVLRPGTVFGPGKRDLTGRIGSFAGRVFIHIGRSNILPLTYIDNCAEAIVLAGTQPGIEGETFNVVDDELLTSAEFLRAFRKRVGPFLCVPFPYPLAFFLCSLVEWIPKRIIKARTLNRRRCSAEWKGNRFSNRKVREMLRWNPRVPIQAAMESFLNQFDVAKK